VLVAVVFALWVGPAARAQEADALDALSWLAGDWERATSQGLSVERWRLRPDGSLEGESVIFSMNGVQEVHVEAMLLVRMGADIFYIARPRQNEYPTGFRLVASGDGEYIFENPNHDFPQRIVYRRDGEDAFTATISAVTGDGPQQVEFHFRRQAR
jgi:hypothetical protein